MRCRAAITAMAPTGEAGVQQDPEGVDDVGASAGADDDCGAAEVAQSEKFWADVGGSPPDPTCIVGGDGADRGELAGGGMKATEAPMAGAVVPVSEAGSRPEATQSIDSRGIFGPLGILLVDNVICSASRPMAGPAGRRRDQSGEAGMAWLGVGRSGYVAQVDTLAPGKVQKSLPKGEGTLVADGYMGGCGEADCEAGDVAKPMRTAVADTEVPVSEVGSHPDSG